MHNSSSYHHRVIVIKRNEFMTYTLPLVESIPPAQHFVCQRRRPNNKNLFHQRGVIWTSSHQSSTVPVPDSQHSSGINVSRRFCFRPLPPLKCCIARSADESAADERLFEVDQRGSIGVIILGSGQLQVDSVIAWRSPSPLRFLSVSSMGDGGESEEEEEPRSVAGWG